MTLPLDPMPATQPHDLVDLDMTWIVIAVLANSRGAVVLDYSAGWHGFLDELHVDDMFNEMPSSTPCEPGAYRWTGYKVGSWNDGDAIVVRGGTFAPYTATEPALASLDQAALFPANRAALERSIADIDAFEREGISLCELENEVTFTEGVMLCVHELKRLRALTPDTQARDAVLGEALENVTADLDRVPFNDIVRARAVVERAANVLRMICAALSTGGVV